MRSSHKATAEASLYPGCIQDTFLSALVYRCQRDYLGERFDEELSISIQTSQTLCYQGFNGNDELYGLGVRTGIYVQWIASLLANNLLPKTHKELQKVDLIFFISICTASFAQRVFSLSRLRFFT